MEQRFREYWLRACLLFGLFLLLACYLYGNTEEPGKRDLISILPLMRGIEANEDANHGLPATLIDKNELKRPDLVLGRQILTDTTRSYRQTILGVLDGSSSLHETKNKPPSSLNHVSTKQVVAAIRKLAFHNNYSKDLGPICPVLESTRYKHLKSNLVYHRFFKRRPNDVLKKYFFALNLQECAPLLPRLLGTIVELALFLGPEYCTISIVASHSTDSTSDILRAITEEFLSLGLDYYLEFSPINPKGAGIDRAKALAELRDEAIWPLVDNPSVYDLSTRLIFLDSAAICANNVLELLHQQYIQSMDMACGMDWICNTNNHDTWTCHSAYDHQNPQKDTFLSNPITHARYKARLPFQVSSCWSGINVITAKPFMKHKVGFLANADEETNSQSSLRDPTPIAQRLSNLGYNRIGVIPAVTVGYGARTGIVVRYVSSTVAVQSDLNESIDWVEKVSLHDNGGIP